MHIDPTPFNWHHHSYENCCSKQIPFNFFFFLIASCPSTWCVLAMIFFRWPHIYTSKADLATAGHHELSLCWVAACFHVSVEEKKQQPFGPKQAASVSQKLFHSTLGMRGIASVKKKEHLRVICYTLWNMNNFCLHIRVALPHTVQALNQLKH